MTALWLSPLLPLPPLLLVALVATTGACNTAELSLRLGPSAAHQQDLTDLIGASPVKEECARALGVEHATELDSRSASEILAATLTAREQPGVSVPAERLAIDSKPEDCAYFRRELHVARRRASGWGGRLMLEYFPESDPLEGRRLSSRAGRREEALAIAAELNIPASDVAAVFESPSDPVSLSPLRQPKHYMAAGHYLVADEVLRC